MSWTVWGMVAAVGKAKMLEGGWVDHPPPPTRAKDSSVIVQSSLFRVLMSYLRRAKDRWAGVYRRDRQVIMRRLLCTRHIRPQNFTVSCTS